MIKNKVFLITLLVFIVTFIFYSWNIVSAYTFDNDAARDLVEIHEILEGDMRLVGPNASFGGLKTGPYYYYLFVPILFLTNGSVEAFLYFNAFIFACAIGLIYWLLADKFSQAYSVSGILAIILSPLSIFAARNPGNANTYIPFLLMVLALVSLFSLNRKNLILTGFLIGVIVNFQYANIVVFIALTTYLLFRLQNKKKIFYYLIPFILTFGPLLLFELRHNFIMTRTTLFTDSYKGFIENSQLGSKQENRNIIENIFFISTNIQNQIGVSPFVIFSGIGLYLWKFTTKKREVAFILFVLGVYVLTILTLQFQFAIHYVFPAAISILFMTVIFLIKEKQLLVLGIVIFSELFMIPHIFSNSQRPYWFYSDIVKETISKKIVKSPESFNIIQIRPETSITPLGYEYRYFFIINGYKPLDPQKYNESKQLLIYSREKDFQPQILNTWEAEQYGKKYLKKTTKMDINGVDLYSIIK